MTRPDPHEPGMTTDDGDAALDEEGEDRPIARFVHDHPGMAIAGGIALGVLAAALLPKRNREFVVQKSSALADAVGAAGLTLFSGALDRSGQAGGDDGTVSGNAAQPHDSGSSGGFDLAGALSALIRHLRKASDN